MPSIDRANLRESMKSISRANTFKRTSSTRQTRATMKKISNVCDGNDATGLMPPPTADSFLSRASSRNNVDEIGIESTQHILQAQVDSKIPRSPKLEVVCATTNGNGVSVKISSPAFMSLVATMCLRNAK